MFQLALKNAGIKLQTAPAITLVRNIVRKRRGVGSFPPRYIMQIAVANPPMST